MTTLATLPSDSPASTSGPPSCETRLLRQIWQALNGDAAALQQVAFTTPGGALPSVFAVTGLAAASVAAAGLATAALVAERHGRYPAVQVDRRLASFWFSMSLRPQGWSVPAPWDPIAGDYATQNGRWIRLHTNAPHHRAAALAALGIADQQADTHQVARAVAGWNADALETAVLQQGGCAGAMRSAAAWAAHPQGQALAAEPLIHIATTDRGPVPEWSVPADRPLAGVRVLDMTRVLAGPTATRLLAGLGAEVLRIDAPDWDEPSLVAEMTLGKRCARLDLRRAVDMALFEQLLSQADVLVHGLRPGALARLGLAPEQRRRLRPGLVDVCLDAYGWSGPWQGRRGFDSIVQMSSGIADAGMRRQGRERPTPLPNQALDHATGYLMAAAVLRGLQRRLQTGEGSESRASLARTAVLLTGQAESSADTPLTLSFEPETPDDLAAGIEATHWGPALRLRPHLTLEGAPLRWPLPAGPLGAARADAGWRQRSDGPID